MRACALAERGRPSCAPADIAEDLLLRKLLCSTDRPSVGAAYDANMKQVTRHSVASTQVGSPLEPSAIRGIEARGICAAQKIARIASARLNLLLRGSASYVCSAPYMYYVNVYVHHVRNGIQVL